MRFVDDHEVIVGKIIDEGWRGFAGRAARQMARVVLDAGAKSHLLEHLEVVHRALLEPLFLDELHGRAQLGEPFAQLDLDAVDRLPQLIGWGHVVRGGEDRRVLDLAADLAAQGIDLGHRFDLVAPPADPDGGLGLVGGEDLDDVAAHAEGAAVKVDVVALVLHVDEAA